VKVLLFGSPIPLLLPRRRGAVLETPTTRFNDSLSVELSFLIIY
jgi:hypothetical protein